MGAGGERCISRPHIGPICHCCLLDPALHFSAMILLPFFVPDAATQSPSPFWIVISLPSGSLHGPCALPDKIDCGRLRAEKYFGAA